MLNAYMNEQDVPSAKEAEAFVTVGEQRYNLLNAKNFEGKANISTKEIPVLGKIISGRKPTGMVVQAKMTVYKCSEMFDRIVTEYKNTGHLPVFELQTTNNDAATCMGRSTKVYHNCVIDGDVLLSMFDLSSRRSISMLRIIPARNPTRSRPTCNKSTAAGDCRQLRE